MQVRVKHLVEYLQSLDQELPVVLNYDGWMEDEINAENEVSLIKERGVFYYTKGYFVVNN